MEASPTAILIADAEGAIVLVNHDLERQFGYTEKELIGQSVDLVLPESLPSIHDALGSAFGDAPADHQVAAGRELVGSAKTDRCSPPRSD